MLARMNTLEEGFKDILKEFKDWRKDETRSTGDERPDMKVGNARTKKPVRRDEKTKPERPSNRDAEENNHEDVANSQRGSPS